MHRRRNAGAHTGGWLRVTPAARWRAAHALWTFRVAWPAREDVDAYQRSRIMVSGYVEGCRRALWDRGRPRPLTWADEDVRSRRADRCAMKAARAREPGRYASLR